MRVGSVTDGSRTQPSFSRLIDWIATPLPAPSSSESAFAAFLYSAGSDCTSAVPSRVISSS